ncbi:MAG: helix-turn-helix domain-containing protein [Mesonia hippocampi]|uniref:helix-turn-helix domain-containing protein n=1 Tax=Mesonia hippocampi TaxID=1628250 RepID=UPI003F9C556D
MQVNNSHNANKIINNLKERLGLQTDKELALLLNIKPNTLSTWRKRESISYEHVLNLCKKQELDLNDVFDNINIKTSTKNPYSIPLISRENLFEYIMGRFSNDIEKLPHYCLPHLNPNKNYAIIQAPDNNMAPIIKQGDYMLSKSICPSIIKPNDVIMFLSKVKGFYLNRVQKINEETIVIQNENPIMGKNIQQINIRDIDEAWLVKAVLSYNYDK